MTLFILRLNFSIIPNLLIFVCGERNRWLETKIIKHGLPLTLACPTTNQTRMVDWWYNDRNSKLRKLQNLNNGFSLELSSTNHDSSGTYECFDSYTGGFHKFSQKVLVVESGCGRVVMNLKNIWKCDFKHVNLPGVDLNCNEPHVTVNKTIEVVDNMVSGSWISSEPVKCLLNFNKIFDGGNEEIIKQIDEFPMSNGIFHENEDHSKSLKSDKLEMIVCIVVPSCIVIPATVIIIILYARWATKRKELKDVGKPLNLKEDDETRYEALVKNGSDESRIQKLDVDHMYITTPNTINSTGNINDAMNLYDNGGVYEEIGEPTYLPMPL